MAPTSGLGHYCHGMEEGPAVWARYDGVADWYDEQVAWSTAAAAPLLARLAGRGSGCCLDLGCGTGVHLAALAEAGWSLVGVDASADQFRVARRRAGPVVAGIVQADVARLPISEGSCTLVVSAFTHTDVEDFAGLAREARRVLEPGGRFIYVGLHPCFIGPSLRSHERTVPAWSIRDMRDRDGRPVARGFSMAAWPAGSGSGTFPLATSSTACWKLSFGSVVWRKTG